MRLIEQAIKSEKRELEQLQSSVACKASWIAVAEDFVKTPIYKSLPSGFSFQPIGWRPGSLLITIPKEDYPWAHSLSGGYLIEIDQSGGIMQFYGIHNVLKEIHKNVFIDFLGDHWRSYEIHFCHGPGASGEALGKYISELEKDYRYSKEIIDLVLKDLSSRDELRELFALRAARELKDKVI